MLLYWGFFVLVGVSLALQLWTVVLSLRLYRVFGQAWAWFMAGFSLMVYRRILAILAWNWLPPSTVAQWQDRVLIPLCVTLCFVVGVYCVVRVLHPPPVGEPEPVATITLTALGIIVGWDYRAEELFGWRRSEVIGKEFASIVVPPFLRERHRTALAHYKLGQESAVVGKKFPVSALHKYGHTLYVEVIVTAEQVGGMLQYKGMLSRLYQR